MNTLDLSSSQSPGKQDQLGLDFRALCESAAFRLLDDRMVVRVTGDDRASFLHGMCSNDVKGAKPGSVLPALVLTEHAHVICEFFLWVLEDAYLIETDRASWPHLREHLEKFLIADDVEMDETALGVLDVEGPRAPDTLASAGISQACTLKPWSCAAVADKTVVGHVQRFGAPACSVIGERAHLDGIASGIGSHGAAAASAESLDALRIANGIARIGVDTAEKTIALEGRLERAISFNKGCYVGQETIERATARGGLKKRLFGLRFAKPVEPGTALMLDGKEVGRVTSSTTLPNLGAVGLAILHHSAWAPGTSLVARRESDGETVATVSDLPFDGVQ